MNNVFNLLLDVFRKVFRIITFSRKSIENTLSVFVQCSTGRTLAVDLDPKWEIKEVKNIIASALDADPEEVKIIFAGKELDDSIVIEDCDLGFQSVLHVVKLNRDAPSSSRLKKSLPKSETTTNDNDSLIVNSNDQAVKSQFFVYCSTCKKITVGKLRVRCLSCKSGAITVDSDPKSWDDVLKEKKISGHCEQEDCCDGVFAWAEFYFKCTEHNSGSNDQRETPLNLIRNNHRRIPCLACTETKDIVFVFPCEQSHVTCLDCFQAYAILRLRERQFILDKKVGYTISCPVGCPDSVIEQCHHFKILPQEMYELYQRFSTEDCVLQAGGILCPKPGCGEGILLDENTCDRVVCLNGCGFVFCPRCLRGYHLGDCELPGNNTVLGSMQNVTNSERASQARWDEASSVCIQALTKPCPQCRTATERSGGCMHMICTRCHFHWCWICQSAWDRECMGTHWFG